VSATNIIPMQRRKKRRTFDIIAEATANGKPLPLEVLLTAMWRHLDSAAVLEASKDPGDQVAGRVYFDRACRLASEAAPYLHPKQQSTTISGDAENPLQIARADPFASLTDETAAKLLEKLQAGELTIAQVHDELAQ
jgi:hypothetical protein